VSLIAKDVCTMPVGVMVVNNACIIGEGQAHHFRAKQMRN